jgi:hypothetical protein
MERKNEKTNEKGVEHRRYLAVLFKYVASEYYSLTSGDDLVHAIRVLRAHDCHGVLGKPLHRSHVTAKHTLLNEEEEDIQ